MVMQSLSAMPHLEGQSFEEIRLFQTAPQLASDETINSIKIVAAQGAPPAASASAPATTPQPAFSTPASSTFGGGFGVSATLTPTSLPGSVPVAVGPTSRRLRLNCPGVQLRIRPTPSTDGSPVGFLNHGDVVDVHGGEVLGFFRLLDGRV